MERAVPILPADDLQVARAFYSKLGFEIAFQDLRADGKSGIMGLRRGTIELTIDAPMLGHGRNAVCSLRVDNADAYYREWSSKIDIAERPREEAWGARTFGVTDPSGNTLSIIGPPLA